jgi:hypothetical protein
MLPRRIGGICAALVLWACAATVAADCFHEFCDSVAQDFKRRNCWPQPFVAPDRQAVRVPLAIMVANGWQRQNTISDFFFESGNQLTEAGQMKVRWIVNEAPEHHRVVYVRRGASPQETAERILAVQHFIARSTYPGQMPPVLETTRPEDNWSADRIHMLNKKFQASFPNPVLPPPVGAQPGGSGSGSGSSIPH